MSETAYERLPSLNEQEPQKQEKKGTFFIYSLVFCVCISGFLFGYDTGVISGALGPLQNDFIMTTRQKEWIVGGTTFGAIFGGFFAGFPLVLCAASIFTIGSIMLAGAKSYSVLLSGRLVVGLGVGIASMVVPVYVSEMAPKDIRGRLTTLNTLTITAGQVIAYIVNIIYSETVNGWRYMFGIGAIPAIIQLVVMPFMPESPRRLVAQGQLTEARTVLKKIYGGGTSNEFIEQEIESIQEDMYTSSQGHYGDLLKPQNLKPLAIACVLQAAQQLSGFNSAMYYAATILQMAGFRNHQDSTLVALIVSITNMVFTMVAVTIIDKTGRRRILILTMIAMVGALIALGSAFGVQQGFIPKQDTCLAYTSNCARCVMDDQCGWPIHGDSCVPLLDHDPSDIYGGSTGCPSRSSDGVITFSLLFSLFAYVASYALGLGYVPWIIQSELFSLSVRGKANGIATATNWICNLIVASTFLTMTNAVSAAGTFWVYAGISFVLWCIIVRYVPETSGKSLEEISALFL
ncbi:general substrate transporter [Backusella circina FSU 941]|nr:general substrate transporter [Backusella circina FSU 941]